MAIIAKYVVLIALLLAISDSTEGRKSLSSGRSRGSSSGGSNSRRQQQTPSSSGHVTKPTFQHSQSASNSHGQQQSGPPIGWNVPKQESPSVAQNKPPSYSQANQGPPPAYSPHNVPGGAHTNINERPPMYSPPGSNAGYPGHQGPPPGYPNHQGPPPGYPSHQGPPPSYHQSAAGGIGQPNTVHHHHYNGNNAFPQPQPGGYIPVAGVQPGFYPAGSFPQQSSSSGLGFGTGIIAGGLGGALLGHALTPSQSGSSYDNNHDRVIIINNTGAPETVGAPGAVAPGNTVAEAPVPLAPFPSQPNAAGVPMQPMSGTDNVTLAPNNNTEPAADQVQYGVMCVPIYVNVSDPVNPENVTLVEQMYCYNATIPAAENTTSSVGPNMMEEQPNMQSPITSQNQQQQSELQNTPPATQKPSIASLADTTIVKSGSFGIHETTSIFGLLISTTIASFLIN